MALYEGMELKVSTALMQSLISEALNRWFENQHQHIMNSPSAKDILISQDTQTLSQLNGLFEISFPRNEGCKGEKILIRFKENFIFKDVIERVRAVRLNATLSYIVDPQNFPILMMAEEVGLRA